MAVSVIVIVPVTMGVVVMDVVIVIFSVAVILILAVVVAVVVPDFIVILVPVKMFFPAHVPAPVGMFASPRERAAIAEVGIEIMVDVAVETYGSAEPRPCAQEDATYEPLRPVVAKGCALIGRVVEIAIGANRRDSYAYCDLGGGFF